MLAEFCGANTFTKVDFSPPTWSHRIWSWKEMSTVGSPQPSSQFLWATGFNFPTSVLLPSKPHTTFIMPIFLKGKPIHSFIHWICIEYQFYSRQAKVLFLYLKPSVALDYPQNQVHILTYDMQILCELTAILIFSSDLTDTSNHFIWLLDFSLLFVGHANANYSVIIQAPTQRFPLCKMGLIVDS